MSFIGIFYLLLVKVDNQKAACLQSFQTMPNSHKKVNPMDYNNDHYLQFEYNFQKLTLFVKLGIRALIQQKVCSSIQLALFHLYM